MSERKYFGTDGVRGEVGGPVMNPEFAMRLGYAAGRVLATSVQQGRKRPRVLIGKYTRLSATCWSRRSKPACRRPVSTCCWLGRCPRRPWRT